MADASTTLLCVNVSASFSKIEFSYKSAKVNTTVSSESFFEKFGKEAQEIAKIVLESPMEFDIPYMDKVYLKDRHYQDEVMAKIKNVLSSRGWLEKNIFAGFRQLQAIYS